MFEILFYFSLGFIVSFCVLSYFFMKNEVLYLLNIIKEDVQNLLVKLARKQ